MSYRQKLKSLFAWAALVGALVGPDCLWAGGPSLDSAHGSSSYGVARPAMTGYATGNCAHCPEMHASLAGEEPLPDDPSGPSPYTFFAPNFNNNGLPGAYKVADNFCFSCHSASLLVQQVENKDYSALFGGATIGVQSILEAFNQASYHGLGDIHTFAKGQFSSWYTEYSKPCNACHNPHLAKRNWENIPTRAAISMPATISISGGRVS